MFKDTGHYYLLKIIVSIKTYLVTSNGELLVIILKKHCEKRLPLKYNVVFEKEVISKTQQEDFRPDTFY